MNMAGIGKLVTSIPDYRDKVSRIAKKLPSIAEGLKYLKKTDKNEALSIVTYLEKNAELYPYFPALMFEDQCYSHATFNGWVNRYAHFLMNEGIRKGDSVAVFMENRPEVLVVVGALSKIGAISALINTNQRSETLTHSLTLAKAKQIIVGEELVEQFLEVRDSFTDLIGDTLFVPDGSHSEAPKGFRNIAAESQLKSSRNPLSTQTVRLGDPCFYIYTSGTTGLPKASIMTHFRWMKASAGFGMCALDLRPGEVIYASLPLYHNNALTVTWSSAAAGGAAIAIRRKFSATNFWDDTRKFNAVAICYIGELCRYLYNLPGGPRDRDNPVRKMIGNGLRPDIWTSFKQRFGIEEVYEFYGASEGNIGFVNLLNRDCTVGFCPLPYAIVEYDLEEDQPVRDSGGFCKKVEKGGTGLLLGEVTEKTPFDGYTNADASEEKLLRNVFESGDVWFDSGDLMKDMGFRHAQFVDRLGDTFRWKGENVSTTEVDEVCNKFEGVWEATTYGVQVPKTDGRAGMVSIVIKGDIKEFDRAGFYGELSASLPAYAIPLFVRVKTDLETTGTFKHKKQQLKTEAFYLDKVDEPIWILAPGKETYEELTQKTLSAIDAGNFRF
ncbi:MAG: long-chain-acyl-CoA synthetase [Myxococcota bacterium]|nr:long-chain-acyl-CoA synthetase [Myxococcota bacterium]